MSGPEERRVASLRPSATCWSPESRSQVRRILAAILTIVAPAGLGGAAETPDIIVILSDDMGFSDVGCYGGEIQTPHLDALATQGLRFTQFYNTGRCCPTRASLLTGLYPHQAGIGHMTEDRGLPGYRGDLSPECLTIAEALAPAGYTSYAVGKWHLTATRRPPPGPPPANWPLQRGFARFYGTIGGAGSFFDPPTLVRGNTPITVATDAEYPAADYYYTDAIADHAAKWIRGHRSTDGPFCMYVAFTAAHFPLHARAGDIAACRGRYAAGYAAVRAARYRRSLRSGVVDSGNTTLWPWPEELGEREFWEWDERNMEVYAAMVESMDRGIGRILAALEETGRRDTTLVCYLQDNGGCAEKIGRQEVPPEPGSGPRQGRGVLAGPADTYLGYGEAWAAVSNTPFRKYKHWVHEGGIATPLIVRWPRGIVPAGAAGRLESTPGHVIDLMPTLLEVAAATYPASAPPLEGRSLVPLFTGGTIDRESICWEHEGNRGVRVGDWKLVAEHGGSWELYDMARDRSEQRNLAAANPDLVGRLAAAWEAYAKRTNVVPWDEVLRQAGR